MSKGKLTMKDIERISRKVWKDVTATAASPSATPQRRCA